MQELHALVDPEIDQKVRDGLANVIINRFPYRNNLTPLALEDYLKTASDEMVKRYKLDNESIESLHLLKLKIDPLNQSKNPNPFEDPTSSIAIYILSNAVDNTLRVKFLTQSTEEYINYLEAKKLIQGDTPTQDITDKLKILHNIQRTLKWDAFSPREKLDYYYKTTAFESNQNILLKNIDKQESSFLKAIMVVLAGIFGFGVGGVSIYNALFKAEEDYRVLPDQTNKDESKNIDFLLEAMTNDQNKALEIYKGLLQGIRGSLTNKSGTDDLLPLMVKHLENVYEFKNRHPGELLLIKQKIDALDFTPVEGQEEFGEEAATFNSLLTSLLQTINEAQEEQQRNNDLQETTRPSV